MRGGGRVTGGIQQRKEAMSLHMHREIEKLKKKILALSAYVEESVQRAVKALEERDARLAGRVIESDDEIDRMEVDLEEDCLKVLALHQPVANDLRFIIAVLKINNDLERIGDLATNIAERASTLAGVDRADIPIDLRAMAEKVQWMLKTSLDALVTENDRLAYQVCTSDDIVDKIHRESFARIEEAMRKSPEKIGTYLQVLSVSRQLERIADHTTNIAEDVIYMLEGKIVRHRNGRAVLPSGR